MRSQSQRSMRLLHNDDTASDQSPTSKLKNAIPSISSTRSSSRAAKRKVDELFRRMQPHSLVQWSEKLLATLKITPKLFVKGIELVPHCPPASIAALAASVGNKHPTSTLATWRYNPESGIFHYGLSFQYTNTDPELTVSSFKDVNVMLTSTLMPAPRLLPLFNAQARMSKDWQFVAETDRRVGLALYEVTLGDWHASSLIALVWTQTHEVAKFYLQMHTMELLYSAPPRPLHVRKDDDLDPLHGLHSYTAALCLRSLDEVYWERECFHVEFPMPEQGVRNVYVKLLDDFDGGTSAARDRMLLSETEPALRLETEAVKYAMDNCLLVDFTLWDADCIPVWGFSRVLKLQSASAEDNIDLSISSLGGTTRRMLIQYEDKHRGNKLTISLTRRVSTPQVPSKKATTWVNHVTLELSVEFINTTFCTKY